MRMPLSQQAAEIVGKSALVILTERVDDVALRIGQMVTMGLPEVLDRPIPRHWKQRGRSWGWTAVMWLAHMLTEGEHRKVSVEAYSKGMQHPLRRLTAQAREPLALRDDRLRHLLHHVSTPTSWHKLERDVHARSSAVYAVPQDVIRGAATTVSGNHDVTEGGLLQCGQRKDAPTRPHIQVMMGSLDPLGMPLATAVLSGERADDGFYMPVIERLRAGLSTSGVLFVGDGTMRAVDTRAPRARHQHVSLSPWPCTGATAEAMAAWSTEGVAKGEAGELERRVRTNARGQEVLAAAGEECERTCCAPGGEATWTARVVVRRSPMHATQQAAGLETRLGHAEKTLAALTPPRGRGTRQITDEATLLEAIDKVLTDHRVRRVLSVAWAKPIERKTPYVGRGRGSASRGQRVIETVRSHIPRIARQGDNIADLTQRFGWKAFVTNAARKRLSVQDAVLCYRNAYRVARLCNRLKSRVQIAPLFVKLNEHIEGLTDLLTLGVRVLTVMECVLRRSLEKDQATLPGLHPENKKKMTDKPTAERILKAFSAVSLTIIKHAAGEEILRRLTPLSGLQEDILQRQGLGVSLYGQLAIQEIGNG